MGLKSLLRNRVKKRNALGRELREVLSLIRRSGGVVPLKDGEYILKAEYCTNVCTISIVSKDLEVPYALQRFEGDWFKNSKVKFFLPRKFREEIIKLLEENEA